MPGSLALESIPEVFFEGYLFSRASEFRRPISELLVSRLIRHRVASMSILSRDPDLSRKPSEAHGKRIRFLERRLVEKNGPGINPKKMFSPVSFPLGVTWFLGGLNIMSVPGFKGMDPGLINPLGNLLGIPKKCRVQHFMEGGALLNQRVPQ